MAHLSTVERFWDKVRKTDNCWLWQGAKNPEGYGRFSVEGCLMGPHRFCYLLLRGLIPDGFYLDHLCRTPACVNPDHLEPVDNRENQARGLRLINKKSGLPLGVTHSRGRYKASALLNGRSRTFGRFDTPEEAHKVYLEAVCL